MNDQDRSSEVEAVEAIRLGIDFGSTTCRASYLYPGDEKVVVNVPITFHEFRPVFPIAEGLASTEMYISRFFPGLVQRLAPDFSVQLGPSMQSAAEVIQSILRQIAEAATEYSGSPIESAVVSHPAWLDSVGQELIWDGANRTWDSGDSTDDSVETAIVSDVMCMCCYHHAREMEPEERATVLALSAGYSGLSAGVARTARRGVRLLAGRGSQAILAGNVLDFRILQSAVAAIQAAGILYANVDSVAVWGSFQYAAEAAKQAIRDGDSSELSVPGELTPELDEPLTAKVDGPVFRSLVAAHLESAKELIEELLAEAGVEHEEIDYVLVEGGSMHLPGVVSGLRRHFEEADLRHLPPEAVAGGAAILSSDLSGYLSEHSTASLVPETTIYVPELHGVPEMVGIEVPPTSGDGVALDTTAPEEAPSEEPPPLPQEEEPPEPEPTGVSSIDNVTLADLRRRAIEGESERVAHDLEQLIRAAQEQLALLRETSPAESAE